MRLAVLTLSTTVMMLWSAGTPAIVTSRLRRCFFFLLCPDLGRQPYTRPFHWDLRSHIICGLPNVIPTPEMPVLQRSPDIARGGWCTEARLW